MSMMGKVKANEAVEKMKGKLALVKKKGEQSITTVAGASTAVVVGLLVGAAKANNDGKHYEVQGFDAPIIGGIILNAASLMGKDKGLSTDLLRQAGNAMLAIAACEYGEKKYDEWEAEEKSGNTSEVKGRAKQLGQALRSTLDDVPSKSERKYTLA